MVEGVAARSGLSRMQIWGMLNGVYGHPDTPEKRTAILAALNEGPGEMVSESDIWPAKKAESVAAE